MLTGQRRLAWVRADEKSTWPVLRRDCHLLFPEEMFAASTPPPSLPSAPAVDISQIPPESHLAVLRQFFAQGICCHRHRRRDLNAHAEERPIEAMVCVPEGLRVFAPEAHAIERAWAECG
jgi:hypothetical protein